MGGGVGRGVLRVVVSGTSNQATALLSRANKTASLENISWGKGSFGKVEGEGV